MQKRQMVNMMSCDSPDHHQPCQELVDCSFTKAIACKVGHSFVQAVKTGEFGRAKRDKPPPDASAAADSYIPRFPQEKMREFTLKELEKATENFSRERLLGRGGFGEVFKGTLFDGMVIAIKVLAKDSGQGLVEFQAEIRASSVITSGSHPNLVPAISFHSSCKRKKAKVMIVYPFMTNGNVSRYLGDLQPSSLSPLDWPTRKKIAFGIARGISGLHELGIVHSDFKPLNVLLDDDFNAHVADLILAKSMDLPRNSYNAAQFHGDEDSHPHDTTLLYGTMGYVAPELFLNSGHSTRKSDVYGFGVTLIQLVMGMPSIYGLEDGTCKQHIFCWVEQLFKNEEDLTRFMHPSMLGKYDESKAIELVQLGHVCAQHDSSKRPLMPKVIVIMEGSSANLKQRWDNYNYTWSKQQLSAENRSETDYDISSHSRRFSYVGAGGSRRRDEEEVCWPYEFDIIGEEHEEIGDIRNQLRQAEDSPSQESNEEYWAGDVWYRHQGHRSVVSCCDSVQPGDASSGESGEESTSLANMRSLENDSSTEVVEVDQNEKGNSKELNSQANRFERQYDEVVTKLKEVLDQMRVMELNHQAEMEEMHEKQNAIMQTIIKMQEQCIQKVN